MERKDLNEFLLVRGGKVNSGNPDETRPLYKLVWSDSELELRYGTFREFHDDIFIREVTTTRWEKKYNYIKNRWILERWIPGEMIGHNKELPLASHEGSYECIYLFEDGDRVYLEPNIKVLDFIITMAEKPHHVTQTELMNQLKDKEEKEIAQIMEAMDYRSDIGIALSTGAGVGYGQRSKSTLKESIN